MQILLWASKCYSKPVTHLHCCFRVSSACLPVYSRGAPAAGTAQRPAAGAGWFSPEESAWGRPRPEQTLTPEPFSDTRASSLGASPHLQLHMIQKDFDHSERIGMCWKHYRELITVYVIIPQHFKIRFVDSFSRKAAYINVLRKPFTGTCIGDVQHNPSLKRNFWKESPAWELWTVLEKPAELCAFRFLGNTTRCGPFLIVWFNFQEKERRRRRTNLFHRCSDFNSLKTAFSSKLFWYQENEINKLISQHCSILLFIISSNSTSSTVFLLKITYSRNVFLDMCQSTRFSYQTLR